MTGERAVHGEGDDLVPGARRSSPLPDSRRAADPGWSMLCGFDALSPISSFAVSSLLAIGRCWVRASSPEVGLREPRTSPCVAPVASLPAPVEVVHVRLQSILHPVAKQFLVDALAEADRAGAALMVVELDTPGGLLSSTREISTAMLGAATPVAVYVAPSGAQAASAGFFLLMAADFAAMAPGTNTGAAHPVGGQGETIEGVMGEKVEQDAAATIRALAGRHGRNVALAEEAVVKSRSFTDQEALAQGLADVVAPDLAAAPGGARRAFVGEGRAQGDACARRGADFRRSRCRASSACSRRSFTPTSPTS